MAWLSGWDYRKTKAITGSAAGTQSNVSLVDLTIWAGSGSDTNTTVYLNLHGLDVNFYDLRFTASDGVTLLYHWVETRNPPGNCTVCVMIPSVPSGGTSIYIYYGKTGAADVEDGDNTFRGFDDFPGASLDLSKWNVIAGAVTVAGGDLTLTGTAGVRGLIEWKTPFSPNIWLEAYARWDNGTERNCHFCSLRKAGDSTERGGDIDGSGTAGKGTYQTEAGGVASTTADCFDHGAAQKSVFRIAWEGSSKSRGYEGGSLRVTHTSNVSNQNQVPYFWEGDNAGDTVDVDWVRVRTFSDPECAWGASGAEESQGAPVGPWNRNYLYDIRSLNPDARLTDRFDEWEPNMKFTRFQELLSGAKTRQTVHVYKQHFGAIRVVPGAASLWVKGYALSLIEENDFVILTTQSFYHDYQVCSVPTFDAARGHTYFEVESGPALSSSDVGGYVAKRYRLGDDLVNLGNTSVRIEGQTLNSFESGVQVVDLDFNSDLYDEATKSGVFYTLSNDYSVVSVSNTVIHTQTSMVDNSLRGDTLTFLTGGAVGETFDIRENDQNGIVTVTLESGEDGMATAGAVLGDRFRINRNNTFWFKLMSGFKNRSYYDE